MDRNIWLSFLIILCNAEMYGCFTCDTNFTSYSFANESNTTIAEFKDKMSKMEQRGEVLSLTLDNKWQSYFITIPSLISIVGAMVIFGGFNDFELIALNKVNGTNFNDSLNFRTRTQEIADEIFNAFVDAQSNMARIAEETDYINGYILKTIKLLTKGTLEQQLKFVPLIVGAMGKKADICYEKAKQTETKFLDVMDSLIRLSESLIATDSENNKREKEQKKTIEFLKESIERNKEIEMNQIKQLEKIERDLNKSRAELYEAINSMPEGGFFYDIINAYGKSWDFTDILFPGVAIVKKLKKLTDGSDEAVEKVKQLFVETQLVLRDAKIHKDILKGIRSVIDKFIKNPDEIKKYSHEFAQFSNLTKSKINFKECKKNRFKCNLMKIYNKTAQLLDLYSDSTDESMAKTENLSYFSQELAHLMDQVHELFSTASTKYGIDLDHSEAQTEENMSPSEWKVRQYKIKYEDDLRRAKEHERELDELRHTLDEHQLALAMDNFSLASVAELKEKLTESVVMMAKVRTLWTKIVEMMHNLAAMIKIIVKPSIGVMQNYIDVHLNVSKSVKDSKPIFAIASQIKREADYLSTYTIFVKFSAEAYLNVSMTCFMPPLRSMIPLSYLATEEDRHNSLLSFVNSSSEAQISIATYIKIKNEELVSELCGQKKAITEMYNLTQNAEILQKLIKVNEDITEDYEK